MNLLFVSALCFAVVGTSAAKEKNNTAEKLHVKEKILLRQGGGRVLRPGTQKGSVTIVNAQKRADNVWLREVVDYYSQETSVKINLVDGTFDGKNPKVIGELSIYVVDDPQMPRMLLAPDDRWAAVNIAPLYTPKVAFFRNRAQKALSRAVAMQCGGMSSNYENNLAGPVPSIEVLDQFENFKQPIDVLARLTPYLSRMGVKSGEFVTYRTACSEGWANQPTSRVERIVWEDVHAIPAKPIKVKFDPAKGE